MRLLPPLCPPSPPTPRPPAPNPAHLVWGRGGGWGGRAAAPLRPSSSGLWSDLSNFPFRRQRGPPPPPPPSPPPPPLPPPPPALLPPRASLARPPSSLRTFGDRGGARSGGDAESRGAAASCGRPLSGGEAESRPASPPRGPAAPPSLPLSPAAAAAAAAAAVAVAGGASCRGGSSRRPGAQQVRAASPSSSSPPPLPLLAPRLQPAATPLLAPLLAPLALATQSNSGAPGFLTALLSGACARLADRRPPDAPLRSAAAPLLPFPLAPTSGTALARGELSGAESCLLCSPPGRRGGGKEPSSVSFCGGRAGSPEFPGTPSVSSRGRPAGDCPVSAERKRANE